MPDSYFQSLSDKNTCRSILDLELPTYRQAYSDRTAWVMSVLSELVYIRFNPLFRTGLATHSDAVNAEGIESQNKPEYDINENLESQSEQQSTSTQQPKAESKQQPKAKPEQKQEYIKAYFLNRITKMIDADRAQLLATIFDKVAYDHVAEQARLDIQLAEFDFKIVKTFDNAGTQAILVENKDYIVLAFRGTETDSLDDIKADARANIRKCETYGMIHSGFYFAYQAVRFDVEHTLSQAPYCDKPLYITGHSLGGAVATVATKFIHHKGGLAACYTFGSPRVGNDDWINNIKTPIHRLVNAADCVTMLPPDDVVVTILATFAKLIPGAGEQIATWLQAKFGGYIHAGNMRYLTNCKPGDFDDVKVLYTVSFFYRLKALVYKTLPFTNLLSDHSIGVYSKKLMIIAFKRNQRKMPDVESEDS